MRRPAEASPRSNRTIADTKTHCDILQWLISTLCNNPTVAAVASNRCSNNNQELFSSKSTPADIPRCDMSSIASQDDLMVNKCLGSSFDLEDHFGQRSFAFLCHRCRGCALHSCFKARKDRVEETARTGRVAFSE